MSTSVCQSQYMDFQVPRITIPATAPSTVSMCSNWIVNTWCTSGSEAIWFSSVTVTSFPRPTLITLTPSLCSWRALLDTSPTDRLALVTTRTCGTSPRPPAKTWALTNSRAALVFRRGPRGKVAAAMAFLRSVKLWYSLKWKINEALLEYTTSATLVRCFEMLKLEETSVMNSSEFLKFAGPTSSDPSTRKTRSNFWGWMTENRR